MAELALVRIDARMIHGQVVTQWIKRLSCTRIIMVDDQFSADPIHEQSIGYGGSSGS